MKNICQVCKIGFESTKPAKTCSPKCRVTLARLRVTDNPNVTLASPNVTRAVTFRFTVKVNSDKEEFVKFAANIVREAKYWYDVPLGAIPKLEKDWPPMPEYMNGRQYFLWWKNNFEKNYKDEPVILNPYPVYDKLEYKQGGESSRHWGT
jgi:hypothetical protein